MSMLTRYYRIGWKHIWFSRSPNILKSPQVMIETLLDVSWEDLMRRHSIGSFRPYIVFFFFKTSWSISTVLWTYIYIYVCVETCWNQRRLCFRVFSDPPTRCWPMYMLFWTWILEEFWAGRFAVDPITEVKCVSDVLEIKEHSPPDTDKHQLGRYLPTLAKTSQVCIPLLQFSMSNVWIILSKANSW